MKRLIGFLLVMALYATAFLAPPPVFADEANVMPARVGRLYLAPMFGFATGAYDSDGKLQSAAPDVNLANLGFALEFGINDWISAAVQWVPGWTIWSDIDQTLQNPAASANTNGVADLFAGAKIQVIGKSAPVQSEALRLAFAPGLKVPLPGPDYAEQVATMTSGGDVTVQNMDKHVLGLGLRTYFDYIINEKFYINLYNEFIYYPLKGDLEKAGLTEYGTLIGVQNHPTMGDPDLNGKVNYGFDVQFELEPVFTTSVAPGTVFRGGLPFNYGFSTGKEYEFTGTPTGVGAIGAQLKDDEDSHIFSLRPNASMFFMGWPLPMEFKLMYVLPVWGKDAIALNSVVLQVRAYFKI